MTEPLNVSFLGLGTMGGAMARHLGTAGHMLTIYNRTAARAEAWQAAHSGLAARVASSPAEAAEGDWTSTAQTRRHASAVAQWQPAA